MSGRTVLVVDDSPDVRLSLELLLPHYGYAVASADNGQAALDYLRTHDLPAVIVLDVRMPVMDGVRFRQEQLRDDRLAAVPVIVVSGEFALEARTDLPGVTLLPKPADPLVLLRLIRELAESEAPSAE